ncbi:MAG: hypothetical protein K8M05_34820 [Deltaproteobacteria bacterium]|nr:hypothetical protein [Kofleriaceae bacterium]
MITSTSFSLAWLGSWLRRWPNGFIVAFVALQLLLPLHYYLVRLDAHDERFAWRMFSPTRMVQCQVDFTVDGQAIAAGREFHTAWGEIAVRGRRVVVEAMGAHLCRKHPDKAVVARLACKPIVSRTSLEPPPPRMSRAAWLRGPAYHMGGFNLCEIPEL